MTKETDMSKNLKSKSSTVTGRRTKYEPRYCEMITAHMAEGYPMETFAGLVGVHRDSLYEWRNKYPEFSDAIKRGRELLYKWMLDRGRAGMLQAVKDSQGNRVPIQFNATVWIFMMKNMCGWRDNPEPDLGEPIDGFEFVS